MNQLIFVFLYVLPYKNKYNILKTYELFTYWDRNYKLILQKCNKNRNTTLGCELNFLYIFSNIISKFLYTRCIEKYTGKIIHILIQSSCCVLNCMLPTDRPNFIRVTLWLNTYSSHTKFCKVRHMLHYSPFAARIKFLVQSA